VAQGGTGVQTLTTAYAPVCAGTTATGTVQVASTGLATSGYVLTSNGSSALPSFQAAPGGGTGLTWSSIAGTTQTAAVNTGYVVSNASQTTITLPATAALGSVVQIQGFGAGGWILVPGLLQTVYMGATASGVGVLGSLTSNARYDVINVVCVVANTTWTTSFAYSAKISIA
jgi:hypothetical protein